MLSCNHLAYPSLLAHHTELQPAAMFAEGYCRAGKLPGILCQLIVLDAAPGWVQTQQAACAAAALQAFARLSAVWGGTYMLAKPDVKVAFDASGKAIGVTSEGQTAKAKLVSSASCFLPKQASLQSQPVNLPT